MFFEILDICTKVGDLHETPDDADGFINRPTIRVMDMFEKVVIRAYTYIGKAPVAPIISPDGSGGLKVEWRISLGECEARLYLPDTVEAEPYLYTKIEGLENLLENPVAEELANVLRTLS